MAADSGCHNDGLYEGQVDKLWEIPKQGLVGCCGDYNTIMKVLEWLHAGARKEKRPRISSRRGFAGLLVKRSGQVMHFQESLRPLKIEAPFHAIGSGRQVAIGAMAAGASAERAIEIACRFDQLSAPPVLVKPASMGATEEA